jgi:hypothetical protein
VRTDSAANLADQRLHFMVLLRYDHVARLQYCECGGERLKHGKKRRIQDPPIVGRRLNGSLVQDVLMKAASVLDDPFQHITERNPSGRVFGAFGAIHCHYEIVLRSQMHRERMSRPVELAILDTNGSRFNDQIQLMRHAPHAQHRIGALTLEQYHKTASATCHCVFPIRGDENEFVIPGGAQNVHHGLIIVT